MPTLLVTGANRGLGLEFARQYAAEGWRVHAACRHPGQAGALRALSGDVHVHGLDVGDFEAIDALSAALAGESIDILLNNAGIYGPEAAHFGNTDYAAWTEVLRIDTQAPLKMAEAFIGQVERGRQRRIVMVSSRMGSISEAGSAYYPYRSAKAALNMVTKVLSVELAPRGVVVAALHPGWVRTRMGGPSAPLDAEPSVRGMRQVIAGLGPDQSGGFFSYDGTSVPW